MDCESIDPFANLPNYTDQSIPCKGPFQVSRGKKFHQKTGPGPFQKHSSALGQLASSSIIMHIRSRSLTPFYIFNTAQVPFCCLVSRIFMSSSSVAFILLLKDLGEEPRTRHYEYPTKAWAIEARKQGVKDVRTSPSSTLSPALLTSSGNLSPQNS